MANTRGTNTHHGVKTRGKNTYPEIKTRKRTTPHGLKTPSKNRNTTEDRARGKGIRGYGTRNHGGRYVLTGNLCTTGPTAGVRPRSPKHPNHRVTSLLPRGTNTPHRVKTQQENTHHGVKTRKRKTHHSLQLGVWIHGDGGQTRGIVTRVRG